MSLVERVKSMLQLERQPSRRSFLRPLSVAAAGAAIFAAVALTPIGSFAQGFLTIFTPRQVVAVPVSAAELKSLPNLDSYVKEIFFDSDTVMAIISGIPTAEWNKNPLPPDRMVATRKDADTSWFETGVKSRVAAPKPRRF